MPCNLDIDHKLPLNGSTASYSTQILVSTDRHDWHSRIEEDADAVFVRQLKKFLGRDGKYINVNTHLQEHGYRQGLKHINSHITT